MSEALIRLERLVEHQRRMGWTDSELARKLKKSPSQVHAWKASGAARRHIGERLARSIEAELELPRFWLDERDASAHDARKIVASAPDGRVKLSVNATRVAGSVPVLPWAAIADMLKTDNRALGERLEHLDTFAEHSTQAKFVEMNDNSMEDEFRVGDHLLVDPNVPPLAGDVVLIRLPSGEHLVRKYVPRTATTFDAESLNANYARLSSTSDHLVVIATMIEHRRYRRSK